MLKSIEQYSSLFTKKKESGKHHVTISVKWSS